MKDAMLKKNHIDEFNKTILDLRNISVPIADEDQVFILVCLLPFYENFVDTILYDKEFLLVNDVKNALQSKELKKNMFRSYEDNQEGLIARSRSIDRDSGNKDKSRPKSKYENIYYFYCYKKGYIRRLCPERTGEGEKREHFFVKLILV